MTHPPDYADPAERTLEHHRNSYQAAADRQHSLALAHLNCTPPEFSDAATACHRAHQFHLQAEALETARRELLAMRMTGERSL